MTDDREPLSSDDMLREVEGWFQEDESVAEDQPVDLLPEDSFCLSCGRVATIVDGECAECRAEVEAFQDYRAHGEPEPLPLFTGAARAGRFVRLVLAVSTIWWVAIVGGFGVILRVVHSEEITSTTGVLLGLVMALFVVTAVLRMVLWRRFVRPPVRDGVLSLSGFPGWRLYREALAVLGRGYAWIVVPVVMWAVLVAVCIMAGVLAD